MSRSPSELPAEWRTRASLLREHGAEPQAKTLEVAAAELEQALRSREASTLNLTEAAAVCGYSVDHLGQLVRDGKIPNLGRKGAPRVRREDLPPRRAGRERKQAASGKGPAAGSKVINIKNLR